MKELNWIKLASVYAGCFLGAGYVSGQELWQYFGAFGPWGYVGLAVSMVLIFLLGLVVLRLSALTGVYDAEQLTVPWRCKPLRLCYSVLELLMMFAVIAIMNAGVGALAEQLFSLPHALISAAFALLVLALTLTGLRGIVSVFSLSVPCLVVSAAALGAAALIRGGLPSVEVREVNGLLSNWLVSAVNYASYNFFVTIAIIAPFGRYAKKRSTVWVGIGSGSLMLLLIAVAVLLSVAGIPGAAEAELPMLFVASSLHPWAAYGYAVLLFFAMLGTALSCQVSFVGYFTARFPFLKEHRNALVPVVGLAAYLAGLLGFGDLIGVLYPVFGYGGAVFILMMVVHYFMARKQKLLT